MTGKGIVRTGVVEAAPDCGKLTLGYE